METSLSEKHDLVTTMTVDEDRRLHDNNQHGDITTQSPTENIETKPRLVIKEMVLDNFKSYAGAQRVGPFHKVRPCCRHVMRFTSWP